MVAHQRIPVCAQRAHPGKVPGVRGVHPGERRAEVGFPAAQRVASREVGVGQRGGERSDDVIDQIEAFKDQIIAGDLVVPDAI